MSDWREVFISPATPIVATLRMIDSTALQIALVVDENNAFLGTVTDGDIRRGILKGFSLDDPVSNVMNTCPTVAKINDSRETILAIMKIKHLRHIPVVDESGAIINLETIDDLIQTRECSNPVLLMAGGMGSRLHPLTEQCPKPLLKVGKKPILETILESFIEHGFRRFYISVNYMGEMVENHFKDGSKWGVEIQYVRETQRMGTAGALGLIGDQIREPILVMNGDLLTKVNFQQLLDFHQGQRVQATMCVREYEMQVPFGVVTLGNDRLQKLQEKPIQKYFINAGIYVLEPDAVSLIPRDAFFDMTQLFNKLLDFHCDIAAFPIREYWIDIGQMPDFERANLEFRRFFTKTIEAGDGSECDA